MDKYFEEALLLTLQKKGKEIAERLTKEYNDKYSKELNEAVMSITLNIAKQVSVSSFGDVTTITLRDKRES